MDIEIIFHSSSTPKKMKAHAVYTKGALLCVELEDDGPTIVKYPLCNVFSIAHKHGGHLGTSKRGQDAESNG
jgi:hypothetical protein